MSKLEEMEDTLANMEETLSILSDELADEMGGGEPELEIETPLMVPITVTEDHNFFNKDWTKLFQSRKGPAIDDPQQNEFERVKLFLNNFEHFKTASYICMGNPFSQRLSIWLGMNPEKFLFNSGSFIPVLDTQDKTFSLFPVCNMIVELAQGVYFYKYTSKTGGDEGLAFVQLWDNFWTTESVNKFFKDFSKELKKMDNEAEWGKPNVTAFDKLILDEPLMKDIQDDIALFIKSRKIYKDDLHLPWKRGYMLIGPPGTGKSLCIRSICKYWGLQCRDIKHSIRNDGSINLQTGNEGKVDTFYYPDEIKPIVYVMEDIDKMVAYQASDKHRDASVVSLHDVLKAMDGLEEYSDAIVIATTNYANQLSEALINRPGRFDRIWEIKKPSLANKARFFKMRGISFTGITCEQVSEDLGEVSMAFVEEFVKSLKMEYKKNTFSKEEIAKVLKRINEHSAFCEKMFGKDKQIGFGV